MWFGKGGAMVRIVEVEWAARIVMIGHNKQDKQHWSKDQSYNWNRKKL